VNTADASLACAWALVDELARGGVRHASVSPGSRSTPLALALSRHPDISVHVHLDERSGSFFALGIAAALGEPVAVACTSGTAAAELFPAVVEASQSRTPLIVLTADRPPRLRGTGANQTIDQVDLYGRYGRAYLEVPTPARRRDAAAWRAAATAATEIAERRPRGPVHVNCPFDEPLTPGGGWAPPDVEVHATGHRRRSSPAPTPSDEVGPAVRRFVDEFHTADGLILAGAMDPEASAAVVRMARALRWPVVAEPMSGAGGADGDPPVVLTAGLPLIGASLGSRDLRPEVVVQGGALPTSRVAQRVAASAGRLVVMDGGSLDPDPDGIAAWRTSIPLRELCDGVADALTDPDGGRGWLAAWRAADRAVRAVVDETMDTWDEPSEMRVARDVAAAVPDQADATAAHGTLFVGNSMPVRDVGAFMSPRQGLRVLANRGASGIDGLLSTALGVASAGTGPTVALLGDLSFVYDAGALLWNAGRGIDLTVVVNDNGGGQIFAALGQGELPADEFERLFLTPHGVDVGAVCAAAGAGHSRVERAADLVPAVRSGLAAGGLHIVRVMIDAERDRRRRTQLHTAVDDALTRLDPR
jgi:2-succinyl-5-enolpyruvyl-6-hydroxy-3-cyclohexene-1-carboxylate synthase